MSKKVWRLPVPATALASGPYLDVGPGRELALRFSYEGDDPPRTGEARVQFEGVEAFKVAFMDAFDNTVLEAYGCLVDRGDTPWLGEVRSNLQTQKRPAAELKHLMILFDDGPCYEVICRNFQVADSIQRESR